ncbi:unnamed protein product [Symbiodinium natans]|uniref:Uncharacterized protein n=1 Tax=Symbiodinium natans TaxID=878477 RepID=A0A812MEQ1_9DINO|nr:unnamed protein product [Symbiodinium natans]
MAMRPSKDPATMRVGVNLGSAEEEEKAAKVAVTMHETMVRTLNLVRLVILGSPVVVQSIFIHSVDLPSWLMRLFAIYAVVGVVGALVAPEQAFYAFGLKEFRWAFLRLYPEAASWNGNHLPDSDACISKSLLGGADVLGELAGVSVRLKWSTVDKFLTLDSAGWAVPGPETLAADLTLQPVYIKGQQLPDTYTLQLRIPSSKWDDHWLACTPVSHLRVGGWLRAYRSQQDASTFKLIQDSSCPVGTCKILSTWSTPPQQEPIFTTKDGGCMPAGFYLVDQCHGGRSYVGQAPDAEASHFELILASE